MAVEFIKVTPGRMRKVRMIAAARVHGRHIKEDKVIEVEESKAYLLVHAHKAEFYVEPATPEKSK